MIHEFHNLLSVPRWGNGSGSAQGHPSPRLQHQPQTQPGGALPPVWTPAETGQEQDQTQQRELLCHTHSCTHTNTHMYRYRILIWASLLQQENNHAATGNVNHYVDYNWWKKCRGWYILANQVLHFQVEMTNFRSLFKPRVYYKYAFSAVQENSHQQKSDQIKILHLYTHTPCLDS